MALAESTTDLVLNALPGPAADLCRELLGRYENLPLAVPVTAALATVSAAVGPSWRLSTPMVADPISAPLQVVVGLASGSLARLALDQVLEPVRAIQREVLAALRDHQPHAWRRQLNRVERDRAAYLGAGPFPEPSNLSAFDEEVARVNLRQRRAR